MYYHNVQELKLVFSYYYIEISFNFQVFFEAKMMKKEFKVAMINKVRDTILIGFNLAIIQP